MSKLENFKYIDDNKILNKYEITPIIDVSNDLDDHFRNTLKDFSPEKATFEYEKSRKNTDAVGKLNTHYYGRRNDTEPFQSDLFLGFTDKDPRSIHSDPLMGNYQKQIWHRKDNLKYSFKDDTDNSIHTAGISESKMQKNKKITYSGFKERYKNFEESNDAWTNSFNQIDSKKSKVLRHEMDGTVVNLNSVDDLKKRRDYVATLSLNALPVGWVSLPDHKVKIAQYTKLLKSKNLNDMNIVKNKQNQLKDNKVIDNSDKELQLMNQLLLVNENIKNKKKESFENEKYDSKFKISQEIHQRSINTSPEHMKNNELKTTELTDKQLAINEELSKLFKINNIKHDIRNLVADFSADKKNLDRGNNKEVNNITQKDKKDIFVDLLHQTLLSQKDNIQEKGNNKESNNIKGKSTKNDELQSKFIFNNSLLNKDRINNNNKIYEVFKYSNKLPEYKSNNETKFVSGKTGAETKLNTYDNEKNSQHRKPNNQSNDALKPEHFENDMRFKSSGEKDRKTGKMGKKYLFTNKEYETYIDEDDNINDSGNLLMKRH